MSKQITVRIPDDLAAWLDEAESKTDVVTAALRDARHREMAERIERAYERAPADTPDEWGDPAAFSDANREIMWSDDER